MKNKCNLILIALVVVLQIIIFLTIIKVMFIIHEGWFQENITHTNGIVILFFYFYFTSKLVRHVTLVVSRNPCIYVHLLLLHVKLRQLIEFWPFG